jgi:(p)ppGpp synthase/HD superfamily hydrolase
MIRSKFGAVIYELVLQVTDVSKLSDGNRAVRKEIDRQHIAKASQFGKIIKLADIINNTASIVQHDPEFAKVYMPEKRRLLEVLIGANDRLYLIAKTGIDNYYRQESSRG